MLHNKIIVRVFLLAFLFVTLSCSSLAPIFVVLQEDKIELNKSDYFLVYKNKIYSIGQSIEVFNLLNLKDREYIIFIHGMGRYPHWAIEYAINDRIEQTYNREVLMFSWPSWIDSTTIPIINAKFSGYYLARFIQQLQVYIQKNPSGNLAKNKKNLLVHSMGARVLKSSIDKYINIEDKLFNNLIISAPEIELQGHNLWLDKIEFANRKFVLYNHKDKILKIAKSVLGQSVLGLDFELSYFPKSKNVTYVNLSLFTSSHSFFYHDEDIELIRKLKIYL